MIVVSIRFLPKVVAIGRSEDNFVDGMRYLVDERLSACVPCDVQVEAMCRDAVIRAHSGELAFERLDTDSHGAAITGFQQSETQLSLEFNRVPDSVDLEVYPHIPKSLIAREIADGHIAVPTRGGKVVIPIANETCDREYSIVVRLDENYVELIRQSSTWLKRNFNFDRPTGYTILGRRSVAVSTAKTSHNPPLIFVGTPPRAGVLPAKVSEHDEVNRAAGLLRDLWSQPIHGGPIGKSYTKFNGQRLDSKLVQIYSGEFRVMCQGFRDLFIHASLAESDLKVRPIDLYNYGPQLGELIAYSHAAAEVFVDQLGKWVLFDPWMGIAVACRGRLLGAEEISIDRKSQNLTVVPLIDRQARLMIGSDGALTRVDHRPQEVDLYHVSFHAHGHSPSYLTYFEHVMPREFLVVRNSLSSVTAHAVHMLRRLADSRLLSR